MSEVEAWVVKGITSGLIDARMDQASQAIVVARSTERVFDAAAWKNLQQTLSQWRGAVAMAMGRGESSA